VEKFGDPKWNDIHHLIKKPLALTNGLSVITSKPDRLTAVITK
jgi:hypothetical protein